jgi:membrane-bound lytic murein transglycosylase D
MTGTMPRPLLIVTLLVVPALLAAAPSRAAAQEPAPRDTITLPAPDTLAIPADTAAPRLPARWATPFAVRSSGRPEPRRRQGEVVWYTPAARSRDSVRVARVDSVPADSAAADSAEAPPPPRRTPARTAARDSASRDSTARPARTTSRDSTARTTRTTSRADTTTRATRTPAARDTSSATRTPASGTGRPRTHTVAAGETFFGIARRYGVTTAQLRVLNPSVDWEHMEVGTVLRLPAGARTTGGSRPAASDTRAPSSGQNRPAATPARRRTHTVAAGETLYGIARRYGVTVDALREANDLEGDRLRTGQTLVIPSR